MQEKISIRYMPLEELIPDKKNPRRNDMAVEPVMESIKEFGFRVPLVIDDRGVIRAGHTRYKAAKALGIEKVPCVIADQLTEKELKAFQLADNKTGEIATWDDSLLTLEMTDLKEIFDMSRFGFGVNSESKGTSSGSGDQPSANSDYVVCPRCGKMFLKSEGHPKREEVEVEEEAADE